MTGAQITAAPQLDSAFVAEALSDAIRSRCGPERAFDRVVIDSREVEVGDLFVALPGEHDDGHDFAADAVRRGASGVLLARAVDGLDGAMAADCACFLVPDALAALQRLAAAWRRALPATDVIGITGNVGKTTTKAITAELLATRYRVSASVASYNNEIGVPLALLAITPEIERAVLEMGMYTTGEIATLCEWARPRSGVVLNVGPTHLERAGSMEAIARAKRELIEALPAGGNAILNVDDAAVREMASHTAARVWFFGLGEAAQVRGGELSGRGVEGFDFTLTYDGSTRRIRVPLAGTHLVSNVLAAATVALSEGMTFNAVAEAIAGLHPTPRLRLAQLANGVTLIDDSYNANPASMEAALTLLEELPGRRLALLGDMRELGALADQSHDAVARRAAAVLDALFTIGPLAERLGDCARAAGLGAVRHLESKAAAVEALRAALRPGDTLLVKGSRALALEDVVRELEAADRADGG